MYSQRLCSKARHRTATGGPVQRSPSADTTRAHLPGPSFSSLQQPSWDRGPTAAKCVSTAKAAHSCLRDWNADLDERGDGVHELHPRPDCPVKDIFGIRHRGRGRRREDAQHPPRAYLESADRLLIFAPDFLSTTRRRTAMMIAELPIA